ncbi:MAG: hypothetical protein BWY92_01684 [Firmicutes bacterium ADurb.BinA052]|nr:MAG: hypothetical protein BWY92_01684 [Firmicutes bacterium ADurb.BinA052]
MPRPVECAVDLPGEADELRLVLLPPHGGIGGAAGLHEELHGQVWVIHARRLHAEISLVAPRLAELEQLVNPVMPLRRRREDRVAVTVSEARHGVLRPYPLRELRRLFHDHEVKAVAAWASSEQALGPIRGLQLQHSAPLRRHCRHSPRARADSGRSTEYSPDDRLELEPWPRRQIIGWRDDPDPHVGLTQGIAGDECRYVTLAPSAATDG